ncbi:MAG: hypothetical protein PVH41_19350 [Anaerolineae bacterium]|jgi:hypothetical protein
MENTRRLVDLCDVGASDKMLDVGCGGATPSYLATVDYARVIGGDQLGSEGGQFVLARPGRLAQRKNCRLRIAPW